MNWIREIVSGKKQRFRESGYNLDLTYITPRIIAMSFPAAGFEVAFRNDIDDVAKLINEKHDSNYLIFNLSGRKYNYQKFDGRVVDYPWEDHHSPPLHFLFDICNDIHSFLCNPKGGDSSVVSVHCLAGKGRTGTVICCYLMFSGAFDSADRALTYYKRKRFQTGGGVTQPSQIRYVKYFERLFFGEPLFAQGFFLTNLICHGIPKFTSDGTLKPLIKIYQVKKTKDKQDDILLFPNKNFYGDQKRFIDVDNEKQRVVFQAPYGIFLNGDILVRLYNQATFNDKLIFRFAFNTAFVKENKDNFETLNLHLQDLDPDKTVKDSRFPRDFYVSMTFGKLGTKDSTEQKELDYIKEEQLYMDRISKILKTYKRPEPKQSKIIIFGDLEKDDIEQTLSRKDLSNEEFEKMESVDEEEEDERLQRAADKEQAKQLQEMDHLEKFPKSELLAHDPHTKQIINLHPEQ